VKVLVCGGRGYRDAQALRAELDLILVEAKRQKPTNPWPLCIIQGGGRGADKLAYDWARENGVPMIEMIAHWDYHGLKAGPLRNQWMIEFGNPDLLIAFPGGAGTANMIRLAEEYALPVVRAGDRQQEPR
jgi:predicted Rossmann-fold nucleotide-binding protein